MDTETALIYGAGALSFVNLAWYAIKIWFRMTPANSIASWMMWVALDAVILGSTIATHQPYALSLSYVAGALLVLIAHFKCGTWVWTNVETYSLIGAVIATILWQTVSANVGVLSGLTAMTLAGIPLMQYMWVHPDRKSFWMFTNTCIACVLTLIPTWPWTIGGSALSLGGLAFNGTMAWMTTRKPADVVV